MLCQSDFANSLASTVATIVSLLTASVVDSKVPKLAAELDW